MRNRLLERGAVAEVTIAVTRVTEAAVAVITIPVVPIPMIAVAFAIPMIAVAVFAIEGTLGRVKRTSAGSVRSAVIGPIVDRRVWRA
jgi:hypothetical protein